MTSVIRNIIFDWSGTLVDDLPAVWEATNHVFARAGVPEMSLDRFRSEFQLPFSLFYNRFLPESALPQLEEWFHSRFREVQDSVLELPHAREFLKCCQVRGIRSFLLSTVHPEHYARQSAAIGFAGYIQTPYLGIHDKRQTIVEILQNHGLDPLETLFIGDMQHDIETAHHGGVYSCAVLTGYNHLAQLRAAKPHLIVEHLGELRALLDRSEWEYSAVISSANPGVPRHPIVTVGGLIFDTDGRCLMIRTRKWSNLWGIPGGKTRFGESSEDALRRELLEETQLEVRDVEFVLVQDCIGSTEFYRHEHFVLLNYKCVAVSGSVVLNDEAQEFAWVTPKEAWLLPLNQPTKHLLAAVCPELISKIS